ncbi:MFS transporter [Hwanghaeella grinnelliae]|uniref:MFS transporter n=1 Tax=Hwanghaeella grinnelliae TaxID=2500179 RepID=A0A3S2W3Q2_9PROT|nr:MFS transporter [Hwanghaeella grinnelliae]RVU35257.1 MFS transporter [Hwanghaeella grinnelliae]
MKYFFGWRVVVSASTVAMFGWGFGLYGPPIYLQSVIERTGWPVALVSAAVTVHFLVGAITVASMPALYGRFGATRTTAFGVVALAAGVLGWSVSSHPAFLFLSACVTGCGWATMGAVALNGFVSPWFVRRRPFALSLAYNGATLGGVVMTPAWVLTINALDFAGAALVIGSIMIAVVFTLLAVVLSKRPHDVGQCPDGDPAEVAAPRQDTDRPMPKLRRNRAFLTLAAGMSIGLFGQVGLLAHLYSLLRPILGEINSGYLLSGATASAVLGRSLFGWLMPPGADRRTMAALSYGVQIIGCLCLIAGLNGSDLLAIAGVMLFGFGIGNATSLPPLIVQVEFPEVQVQKVVSLVVSASQGTFAFAPAIFGLLRETGNSLSFAEGPVLAADTAAIFAVAICCFLSGRGKPSDG